MVAPVPVARVVTVQGQVYAKGENGALRLLRTGDFVHEGEIVVTGVASSVELATMDGQPIRLGANEALTMHADMVVPSVPDAAADAGAKVRGDGFKRTVTRDEQGQDPDDLRDETVRSVSGTDGGPTFVRLQRIVENLDPLRFEYGTQRRSVVDERIHGGDGDRRSSVPGAPMLDVADSNGVDVGQATVYERGLLGPGDASEEASGTITLRCGASAITITAGGIEIVAPRIDLN